MSEHVFELTNPRTVDDLMSPGSGPAVIDF